MKKIYLSLAAVALSVSGAMAQQVSPELNELGFVNNSTTASDRPAQTLQEFLGTRSLLWTESFDVAGTSPISTNGPTFTTSNGDWTTGGADGLVWKHSYATTNGEWSTGTPAFTSTTAANGFMLFDADSVNQPVSPNYINLTGELISPPIYSLSTETSALLVFEQDARFCCSPAGNEAITVSVSSDGGATWSPSFLAAPGLAANTGFSGDNGGFVTSLNITPYAALQDSILLKFNWDGNAAGNSHYYWNIDDICIVPLPSNDVQLLSAWAIGDNNDGMEYGITPQDMQDANLLVGAQVVNFGANTQTNVTLNVTGTILSSATNPSVVSGDTIILESTETYGLTTGVYTGNYDVVSDLEVLGDSLYGNNTGLREFEISEPSTTTTVGSSIYALDGVGVYTNPSVSSIGTASFNGGEDGLVLATEYRIKSAADVSGIRIILASGTVAGGDIAISLKDTAAFRAGDMSSLYAPSNLYTVTSADVSAGFVDITFDGVENVPAGGYYACAELYSNSNSSDIVVVDDETVLQPGLASMIYIPGDQSYGNGEAIAIRLLMGDQWSVGLNEEFLSGVSVYPNPSEGEVTITNESGSTSSVVVYDLVGNVILSTEVSSITTIDLSSVAGGMYVVKVSNGSATFSENVVIK